MTKYKTKTVPIDEIEPGMIIAQDIFTDMGQMLISTDTKLDEKHLRKLKLYQIKDAVIKEVVEEDSSHKNNLNIETSRKDRKKFQLFTSSYLEHNNSLKDQMMDISEGKEIDISELFSISSDLLDCVKHRSNLFNFLSSLQSFDDYTYSHCINVSLISYTIGQWLGFSKKELMNISVAGLLHDIGKTKIDRNILNKPGPLTNAEYEIVKKHSTYGFKIIEKQDISYNIKMAVLMHHERYDGSGYPLRAKNNEINNYAKIVAIADVYDALTSKRPYRDKFSPFYVIDKFEKEYLGKMDTRFLMKFLQNIAYCYLDNWCLLSTGEEAKIIFINKQMPSRPIVQIDNTILDLSQEIDIYIESVL
ncbi:HD-GYP domain-containing protein [Maledivibacter halophilus]|uniref:HDIG domain-containing protein n=1 Tax=Maledivibacter halophilus TaxID=36842 RepID=A0A1T5K5T2_9FIRM|nr:HD-GYP domain-containing protein [Maledivibacter halophilus]SKC58981.1 HDIG domain-containing protein [Maledivibacter halophilus]